MRKALGGLFEGSDVDAVVIDQAACGWALSHIPDEIPIYYVAHNHETTVRREVALEHDGPLPLRLALRRDAALYAALEHRLCARARGIAAITPRDEAAFRLDFPDKPYLQLPPGFRGPIPDRLPPISESTPRRVVLAGTFAWIAKRRNLEAFLAAAAPVFPAHGIGFHVVGKSAPGYFESLAARHPWASFAANVPLMAPHLADARIGLIPEALGGGFKLKALDYVFRGLPLAAVEPALSGLPLEPGTSALAAADLDALARLVVEKIDNLEFLNRCAATALENCRDAFRWSDRGRLLADFLIADRPASAGQSS